MSQRIVTCPSCGAKYRIPDTFKGTKAACKKCGTVIQIPPLEAEAQASSPQAEPPKKEAPKEAAAPESKEETPQAEEKKERPRRGRSRSTGRAGRTRTGARGSRRARAAAEEEEKEGAEEEAPRSRRSGRAGRSGGRSRAGARAGSRRGGRRRGGEDEEAGGGNNTMVIGLVAGLVIVAGVGAYFLFAGGGEEPAQPKAPVETAQEKTDQPKADQNQKPAEPAAAQKKDGQTQEAAAQGAGGTAQEKPKKEPAPAAAPKPKKDKPEPAAAAPSGEVKKKKRRPPAEVDLESLKPLDFPPGTPDSLKEEIKSLCEDAFDVWGGARQNRAIARLIKIGYPAIPMVINKIIKLDYMKKEDVQLGQVLFRALTDMCNGQGLEYKGEFDEVEQKDPWDCEYDIRWNRAAAYQWYKYWTRFGDSKENWEKHVAFKKKKK